jgi:hypothetical protein
MHRRGSNASMLSMNFFARAVVTGFAFSLGAAVFKKVSKELGLDDKPVVQVNATTVESSHLQTVVHASVAVPQP